MTEPSVPTDPEPTATADPSRPGRRRRWWWIVSAAVVLGIVSAALFVPTPYFLLEPGSVRAAEPAVSIEGARSYRSPGEVMFTTVFIDRATVATLLRGAADDAIEVRSEEEVYGPEGRRRSQQANQQRMDLSKLVATRLALQHLGYPAEFTADGARVLGLSEDSPSTGRITPGDVIVAVNGRAVQVPAQISEALSGAAPGTPVGVTVERGGPDGPRGDVQVLLGADPEDPARPVLGVSVDPVDPRLDSPVTVTIDSGEVTGPSAGLAWALAVIDRLTPGSLTDGRKVAVTGEILPDGTVGPIGGIEQKVAAVKRNGVKLFLYPASTPAKDRRAIERLAGDDLEVRPVATLDEAIAVLDPAGSVAAEARRVQAAQAAPPGTPPTD